MKSHNLLLLLLPGFLVQTSAFPNFLFDIDKGRAVDEVIAEYDWRSHHKRDTFDASRQRISTTGANAFVPPSSSDLRGPCPGLNALANHNYLPHNGVATITQYANATNKVFGLGLDNANILATLGAVLDGDLTSWSMGGAPSSGVLGGLLGGATGLLLGTPQGLDGSHNKYETDGSPTRGDMYLYGNNYKLVMSQCVELFNMQPDASTANYNLDVLTDFRASRYNQSLTSNPYFFKSPISGILGQTAGYTFIWRLMANHSADSPEGHLNQDVLKTFFAITGDDPSNFQYQQGYERIPDNWYRRSLANEYSLAFFASDLVAMATKYPAFLSVGGNTGTTNSFVGLDVGNLTGGVYTAQNLLQGNNAVCFAFQSLQILAPDILSGLFKTVTTALGQLTSAIGIAIAPLGCPPLAGIKADNFSMFPGYSRLNVDGQY